MQRAKNPYQLAKNVQEKFSIAERRFMNLKVLSKPGSTRAIHSLRKVELRGSMEIPLADRQRTPRK